MEVSSTSMKVANMTATAISQGFTGGGALWVDCAGGIVVRFQVRPSVIVKDACDAYVGLKRFPQAGGASEPGHPGVPGALLARRFNQFECGFPQRLHQRQSREAKKIYKQAQTLVDEPLRAFLVGRVVIEPEHDQGHLIQPEQVGQTLL